MNTNYMKPLDLTGIEFLYGRAEGKAPAGMFTLGDSPVMLPGSRSTTIDGQDVNSIWTELNVRLAAFNRLADAKIAMLSAPVSSPIEKVGIPKGATFQRATELGKPTKLRVEMIARAFPLEHYDLGYGYTQEYLDYATSAQILAVEAEVRSAWTLLKRNKMLEALFTRANATQEALTILRLYNSDGEIPPPYKRFTHTNTHDHYLRAAGAAPTEAILDTMEDELTHHGFGNFGENLYLLAARTETEDIMGLTDWVPAPSANRPMVVNGFIVGGTPGSPSPALDVLGYHHRWTVCEDEDIPAGYMLGFATGGTFASRNPVGVRLHENPSAQGLRLIRGPQGEYPLIDAVYDGYVGFGIRQRGAAVVLELNQAGAYVAPSFEGAI